MTVLNRGASLILNQITCFSFTLNLVLSRDLELDVRLGLL